MDTHLHLCGYFIVWQLYCFSRQLRSGERAGDGSEFQHLFLQGCQLCSPDDWHIMAEGSDLPISSFQLFTMVAIVHHLRAKLHADWLGGLFNLLSAQSKQSTNI